MNTTETVVAPATPPASTTLYFKKVLSNIPFHINRVIVQFEQLDRNIGVLKLNFDDPIAAALMATAKANRGGIQVINAEIYEELKKKLPYNPLAQRFSQPKLQVLQFDLPRKHKVAAGNAVDGNQIFSRASGVANADGRGTGASAGTRAPVPVSTPQTEFKPAVGAKAYKMPVVKKTDSRSFEGGTPEPEPTG